MSLKYFKNIDQYLEAQIFEANVDNGTSGVAAITQNNQNGTSGQGEKADPGKVTELGAKLNEWSETFGTVFKFKYDHPKQGDKDLEKFNKDVDYVSKLKNEIETPEGISENFPEKAISAVQQLANLLNSGDYKDVPVYVIGHCSSPGSDQYNLELSGRRARLVKYAVQKQLEIEKYNTNKLFAKSDGEKKLIITNDDKKDDGKEAVFNTGVDGDKLLKALGKDALSKFKVKSLMNQRVQVSVKYPADIITPDPVRVEVEQEKPEEDKPNSDLIFDPTSLDFLEDSYLIKKESIEQILKPFADKINKVGDKIKSITIVGHAERVDDKEKYDKPDELKGMYILSLNRSSSVREKLDSMITLDNIKFENFGCGMDLSDDYTDFEKAYPDTARPGGNKVVEIFVNFIPTKSKESYKKLSGEYNVESTTEILKNDCLLRTKVWNIYMKVYGVDEAEIIKNIPLEFRKDGNINPHIKKAIQELPELMQKIDSGDLEIPNYKKQIEEKLNKITVDTFDKEPTSNVDNKPNKKK